jgi:hypothetical protein
MSPIAPYRTIPSVLQVVNVPCPHCQSAIQVDRQGLARPGGFVTNCIRCREQVVLTSADVPVIDRNGPSELHVRGADLIVASDAESPERCVKCNAPAQWSWSKTLYWHHPALYLLILAGVFVYALLALVIRKSGRVTLFLCPEHVAKRRRGLLVGWTVFLSSIGLWCLAGAIGRSNGDAAGLLTIGGVLAFLGGVIWIGAASRVVTPKRIADGLLTLKGAGRPFLASLSTD